MGEPGEAVGNYKVSPLAEGFVQGYLTMDVLSALVLVSSFYRPCVIWV